MKVKQLRLWCVLTAVTVHLTTNFLNVLLFPTGSDSGCLTNSLQSTHIYFTTEFCLRFGPYSDVENGTFSSLWFLLPGENSQTCWEEQRLLQCNNSSPSFSLGKTKDSIQNNNKAVAFHFRNLYSHHDSLRCGYKSISPSVPCPGSRVAIRSLWIKCMTPLA